ncbi:cobalamin biosynthesis protein CobD [Desulfonema ishimotonii]|uniref:Cobalamin biosynthesis protein CobD n=1 Tax=Desulfonema ishimotonii TaxID=45657 RepID=A0A401G469_9BACT|nr:adenosylcobinamide-phosphate synthase CbiB [Desulfonema ishimotonii]GBC64037.1 cobalamin biosynthesis protein CobD [Desulfonema ishimotonii]
MDFLTSWYVLPAAFVLDLIIGDPQFAHHPVRYMGRAIEILEPKFRKLPVGLTISGGLFAALLICATWAAGALLLETARLIHPLLKNGLEILMIYFCIAFRGLEYAAMEIYGILRRGNLAGAREKLAMIVGRDVRSLSETGVARATVETVGENLVDGVISPLFFAAIGGAPLMMAYKMVNTLDSMVGYKNETYRAFGKIPARIDDVANFIPARLSVPMIALAAHLLSGRGRYAFDTARREGRHHASPNAGFSEAAFAGALEVKLGGPNIYHGEMVHKPFLGSQFGPVRTGHIRKACDLMVLSSLLWLMTICGTALLLALII